MKTNGSVVLVTGANRGLGRALVEAAIARGAKRVYAAARDPKTLDDLARASRDRIVPVQLDITNAESLAAAAKQAGDVTLLVNNAGVLASASVLASTDAAVAREFETNFFGTLAAMRAFAPALERAAASGGSAAIVNVLSIVSVANMPAIGGYSAAKAAAFSVTQALRAELGKKGVRVHAALPGAIDTDMVRDFAMPKTSPAAVAAGILDGVERDEDEILPDPQSKDMFALFRRDPKELERQLAASLG